MVILDPGFPIGFEYLALGEYGLGQYTASAQAYRRYIDLTGDPTYWFCLASALQKAGEIDQARESYQRYLRSTHVTYPVCLIYFPDISEMFPIGSGEIP